jgi:hypothetical protein
VTRIPSFTTMLAHGAGPLRVEDSEPVSEAAMGRWERILDIESVSSEATLQTVIQSYFDSEASNADALTATVLGSDSAVPLVNYTEGDVIWWQFPGLTPKVAKRVRRIGWELGTPTKYQAQASTILSEEGGLAAAVKYLLAEFRRRHGAERVERGAVEAIISSANALGAHAHVAAGTQEIDVGGEAIQWTVPIFVARNVAPLVFPTASVMLLEPGYYDFSITIDWATWLQGGAVWLERTRGGVTETVWPPSTNPGIWTATTNGRFRETAPALIVEANDIYTVWVDHLDGSAQDISQASLVARLVDRTFTPAAPVTPGLLVWTEDDTYDFGAGVLLSDVYVIAGGGAGGDADGSASNRGGGGGAGGVLHLTNYTATGVVTIVVGEGGAINAGGQGDNGEDSSFDGQTADGGGGGGGQNGSQNGAAGGSGGGACPPSGTPGAGTAGQGSDGGADANDATSRGAGGGGGFSQDGLPGNLVGSGQGGDGGDGLDLSALTTAYGESGWFAGGGGGAHRNVSAPTGYGGQGGGGDATTVTSTPAEAGAPNTGGGGGGAFSTGDGGVGGKGIVIAVPA